MGRKTHESIGKVLQDRVNIVISRKSDNSENKLYESALSLADALKIAKFWSCDGECFIIGGAEIYKQALRMKLVHRLYITEIYRDFDGDAFFDIDYVKSNYDLMHTESHTSKTGVNYSFGVYE